VGVLVGTGGGVRESVHVCVCACVHMHTQYAHTHTHTYTHRYKPSLTAADEAGSQDTGFDQQALKMILLTNHDCCHCIGHSLPYLALL
jgi:hypothetical protein